MSKELSKLAFKFKHILNKTAQQVDLDNAGKVFQQLSHVAYTYAQQVKNKQLIPAQLNMHIKEEVIEPAFAYYQHHQITKEQYDSLVQYAQYFLDHKDEMVDNDAGQPSNKSTEFGTPVHSLPDAKPEAPKSKPIGFRDDVRAVQEMLNELRPQIVSTLQEKKIVPKFTSNLNVDGKLGPKTKEALNDYKIWMGVPSLSDEQAIAGLNTRKQEVARGTGFDPETGVSAIETDIQ